MANVAYKPLSKEVLRSIKAGDVIERMLAFEIPMYLIVAEVTEDRIKCAWEFDRDTGLEIDEDIQDMSVPIQKRMQISYIRRVLTEEQKDYLKAGNKEVPYLME